MIICITIVNRLFSINSDGLVDRNKCSLIITYSLIDAISTTTDFKCKNPRSEYLLRTCSVATSLVTSLKLLLLCRAVVDTE